MSDNENELSEDELNSLLADLESRADTGGGGGGSDFEEEDDEDLDAYLERLESEEADAGDERPVKTSERDDELSARFDELDDLQPDDLPAKPEESKPDKKAARKKKKADKKAKKEAKKKEKEEAKQEGPSRAARVGRVALRVLMVAVPVAALMWVLGSFLANWVSAGWLIAIMALIFALGVPALVNYFVGKGKFRWWAAGLSLLFTVGLTVPMPEQAGESITSYGHWPASAVAEIAGWQPDAGLVRVNASVAGALGGLLHPGAERPSGPHQLGTGYELGAGAETEADETDAEEPAGDQLEGGAIEGEEAAADEEFFVDE